MKKCNSIKEMLDGFQKAWSSQDKEAVISFFADKLNFEDIPASLYATNKEELYDVLNNTFKSVPDFTMEIFEFYEGKGFVATKWKQSGTITTEANGLNLKNFPYEVITTSIIQIAKNGLITSVSDNWNSSVFFQ